MASTPKGPQKMKLDFLIDRKIYDEFIRQCTKKGYSPKGIIEKLMAKYTETGNV